MRLKMSYINRGILLNDFKRFGWISAGYLLGMLLSVPLMILTLHTQVERTGVLSDRNAYLQVFQFNSPLQLILLILVPILTGLWLFQYLQDGKAADMAHALPVKRETLYNTHILAGLIFLFVPLMITALVSWALIAGLGITQVGSLNVLIWLAFSLLFNLLFFMTSVATGMSTGMSTVQAVLSLILLLLPSGLAMLLMYNFKMYAYGFAFDHYYGGIHYYYSPLLRISNIFAIQSGEIIAYLLICIALYLVGRYLYQRRQLETAGDAITFGILRPIFKYGATFCFMMLAGSYFFSTQNGSMSWTYFGYVIGSLAAYFLSEILLNKSLHVFQWKAVKGYGVFSLVIVLLIAWLHFGLGGYEQKVPELSQVDSVYFANYFINEQANTSPMASQLYQPAPIGMTQNQIDNRYLPLELPLPVFKDANSIADIYGLHQKLIDNRAKEKTADPANGGIARINKTPLCLVYNLKNGTHIYRQYTVRLSDYTQQLKPLYESSEYKYLHNAILEVNPAEIKVMDIAAEQTNRSVRLVDPKLIQQAVATLQSDIGQQTYEETISERPGWAHITILLEDKRTVEMEWEKSYVNFDQWLKDIGEYNNARLIPRDDIQYAIVVKGTVISNEDMDKYQRYPQLYLMALEKSPGCLKVSDPENLEACLRYYTSLDQQPYTTPVQSYQVVFLLKNGSPLMGAFTDADAPAFVKEHFASQKKGI